MFRIKCGDRVIVLSGKDRGKIGDVFRVFKSKKTKTFKVFVSGINIVKRHCKKNEKRKIRGGIYLIELGIDISKLAIINKISGKHDKIRTGYLLVHQVNKKIRIFKSDKKEI